MRIANSIVMATVFGVASQAAMAEPSDAQRASVAAAFQQARTDYRVVLTCSALEPQSSELLERQHAESLVAASAMMREAGFSGSDIQTEIDTSSVEALRLPLSTSYADVISFCNERPNWMREVQFLEILPFDFAVERALDAG